MGRLSNSLFVYNSDTSIFAAIIGFIVVIGFLLMSLKLAQEWGIAGASRSIKVAGAMGGYATSRIGQATVGAGGRLASRAIRSTALGRTGVGRQLLKATDYVGQSSYDVGVVAGGISGAMGGQKLDFGKRAKGYGARMKEEERARVEHGRTLKMTTRERRNLLTNVTEDERIDAQRRNVKDAIARADQEKRTAEAEKAQIESDARTHAQNNAQTRQNVTRAQTGLDAVRARLQQSERDLADLAGQGVPRSDVRYQAAEASRRRFAQDEKDFEQQLQIAQRVLDREETQLREDYLRTQGIRVAALDQRIQDAETERANQENLDAQLRADQIQLGKDREDIRNAPREEYISNLENAPIDRVLAHISRGRLRTTRLDVESAKKNRETGQWEFQRHSRFSNVTPEANLRAAEELRKNPKEKSQVEKLYEQFAQQGGGQNQNQQNQNQGGQGGGQGGRGQTP
jgi:hypothetical protein